MGMKSLDGSFDVDFDPIDEGRGMELCPENSGGDDDPMGGDSGGDIDITRLDTKFCVDKILSNGWQSDEYQARESPDGIGFTDYDLIDDASGNENYFSDDDDDGI